MGANIPLPALHLQQPEQQDPLAKALTLRSMIQQQQMGNLELQQRQLQLQDTQAMTSAMQEWDGKDLNALPTLILKHGGSANAVMGMKKNILDQQTTLSTIAKNDSETGAKNLETIKGKNDLVAGALNAVTSGADEGIGDRLLQTAQSLVKQQMLDPQHYQQAQEIASLGDPTAIRGRLAVFEKGLMANSVQIDQAMKEAQTRNTNAEAYSKTLTNFAQDIQLAHDQNSYDQITGMYKKQLKPEIAAQIPTQFSPQAVQTIKQLSITPAEQLKVPVEMLGLKDFMAKNPGAGPADFIKWSKSIAPMINLQLQKGLLDDNGLDMAANMYLATGTLPSGMRSPAATSAIINRAAQLDPNGNVAQNKAIYGANLESLKGLQKNRDAVVAFENTAGKNLDLFLQQAKQLDDSFGDLGSPLLNKPWREAQQALGGTQYTAYNTARRVAINEVAKVTSNPGLAGELSDSARKEVESFNPDSATLKQTERVVQVLRQDMTNRHQSYDMQIRDIQNRFANKSPANTGGTPPPNNGTRPPLTSFEQK